MSGRPWPDLDVEDVLLERVDDHVEGHQQVGRESDQDQDRHDDRPEHGEAVAAEPLPGVLPQADLLLGDLPIDWLIDERGNGRHQVSLTRGSMNTYSTSTTRFAS